MEQHLVPYEMECMKMAILKHEEIFKQQVYELHRLYQIQKMLMKQTTTTPVPKVPNNNTNHPPRSKKLPRPSSNKDCVKKMYKDDDEAIDLTLGLGNFYYSQKSSKKLLSPTRLTTSDSVMSFSSSSSGSSSHPKGVCPGEERRGRQDQGMEQPPWLLQVLGLNI